MDTTGTLFFPPAGSTLAGEVDSLFYFIFWASAVLFAIVIGLTVFFIIRYRRRRPTGTTYGRDHNLALEITWTAVPTVLILIVFVWGFRAYMRMTIVPRDALEVKVTAQKWFSTFDYPNGANSVNELVAPVDRPVKLLMSSRDVIHSLFVPDFRMKMDVLPNRYSVTWFEATRPGTFNLFCTEYCGTGHSEMLAKVKVVSEREFAEFLASTGGPGAGESPADYGRRLYTSRACNTCHTLDGKPSVGPTWQGLWGRREALQTGDFVTVDENYIRESVLEPQARVTAGFQPVMPTYQGILTDRDIDALIAFIKSLDTTNSEAAGE